MEKTVMDVFKSRRFISAVVILLIMVLVAFVPDLESAQDELVTLGTVTIIALISGYSLQDVVREMAGPARQFVNKTKTDIDNQALDMVLAILRAQGYRVESSTTNAPNVNPPVANVPQKE